MEGASHDMMMAHYQSLTGMAAVKPAPGLAEAEVGPVGSSAQPGHSSPAVQQATLPDEAVAQKGWCVSEKPLAMGLVLMPCCVKLSAAC